MYYAATIIKHKTFQQLKNFKAKNIEMAYAQLCYEYTLIFVEEEHSIIFFNMHVILDKIQYDFLLKLVENATKNKNKGISSLSLFRSLKCRHTKSQSKQNLTEEQRADERIRSIKYNLKQNILNTYNKLACKYGSFKDWLPLGISIEESNDSTDYYFNGEFLIEEDSPYYNFQINSALKNLFINNMDKKYKNSTSYQFK